MRKSINSRVSQFSIFLGAILTLVTGTASLAQTAPALIQFTPAEVYLVAGLNGSGYSGDNNPAIDAQLNQAEGLAYDSAGNLYIGDSNNYVVRKVDTSGIITTFAGSNNFGYSGDNMPAIDADFKSVSGLAFDAAGDLYIADPHANVVRKVDIHGTITTVAGTGTAGYTGDGLAATAATLDMPWALAFDAAGNLYIADELNQVVRIVDTAGKINTFAGNGFDHGSQNCGTFTPFTGAATSAQFCQPQGVATDANGNVYISDTGDQVVWVVNTVGNISIFAGTGGENYTGDGGPATSATFHFPQGLVVDSGGNLYISDEGNSVIRKVDQTGTITTVFGNGAGLSKYGIGKPDTQTTNISGPESEASFVTIDPSGNIVVASAEDATVDEAGTTGDIYFTNQPVFTTQTYYLVIANPGGQPLTFSGVPTVSAPFGISGGTCNLTGTLAAGASCTVGVTFTPTADQLYNGSFVLDTNAAASPSTVKMTGTGKGTGVTSATLLPSGLNFTSSVGVQSAPQTITLTNTGNYSLAYDGVSLEQPSSGFSETNNCPATLAPGAFCQFQVSFTPTAATTFSSRLSTNIPAVPGLYSVLDGTGTASTATPVISPLATPTYNAPVAVEITDATPGSSILYSTDGTVPSVAYNGPFTVATSGTQVQALANASGDTTSATASSTYTIQPYLQFSSAQVEVAAPQLTATFSLMGSITPTATLHYGLDYSLGAVSCTPSATGLTEVCILPINFTPTLPGPRKDALFLMNGTTQLASVLLGGVGQAPLSLVQPPVVTNPYSDRLGTIWGSTVDENGTVYVQNNNSVYTVTKAGVVTTLPITGLNGSWGGIAIDGAGILYIGQGDYGSALVTYNTVTGVQGTLSFVPPSPYVPCSTAEGLYGLVVDDIGDVFALDNLCNQIFELKPNGTYVVDNINPAMLQPSRLAVDAAGNIFVSGYGINEIPVTGTQTEINTVAANASLAVDAADTLYVIGYPVAPYGVAMLATSNYQTPLEGIDGGTGGEIESPFGISLGSDGTLFVGNGADLDKVDRTQGAISFGEQFSGSPSSAQNVGIYNGGNQPLTLASFALNGSASGFATQAPSSGTSCTNGLVLQPGTLCQIAVTLTPPHAGTFTGTVTFTTNSLNTASTVQSVALSGFAYGVYVTASPNPLNFANQVTNTTSAAQTVTLTNNGILYSASIGIPTVSGYNITGSCSSIAPAGGTCLLTVSFEPTVAQVYDETVNLGVSSSGGGANLTTTFAVTGTGFTPTPTPTPVILPTATPTYNAPVAVEITDSNSSANISYSTDGTAPSLSYPGPFTVTTSGTQVQALANSNGNPVSATASNTYTIQPYLQFGPSPVGSPLTLTATFSFLTSAVPTPPTPALHYGHDYTAGSITCTPTASTLTEVCTVPVTFVPTLPGARKDALFLTSGGSRIATVLLYGVGQAPMGLFLSGIVTTYQPNNVAGVDSLAVDDNDTAYVATPIQGLISVTKSGTVTTLLPKTTVGSKSSVAIDGAGVLYTVAVGGAGITYDTVQGVQGTWNLPTLPGNDLWETGTVGNTGESYAISVSDSSDAPFFYAVNPDGTYQSTALPAAFEGSPYSSVEYAAAVDSSENVFAGGGPNLYEIVPPTTIPSSTINTGGSSTGLGVDAADTVYQTLPNGTGVELLPTSSYGTAVSTISPANLSNPGNSVAILGVSVGPDGTVFLTDTNGLQLINRSQSPTIDFGTVNAHTTSVAQTTTIYNGGNLPLNISSIATSTPTVFTVQTASSNPCGNSIVLQPGALCEVAVTFTPSGGGSFSDSITITSNTLGAAGTAQTVALTGNGKSSLIAQAINFAQPAPVTYAPGLTITLSATGGGSGNPVVFTIAGGTGTGTLSGNTLTVTTAGSFVIDANQAGNANYTAAPQVQQTAVVNLAAQAINFAQPSSVTYAPGLTITLSATGGGSGNPVVFTIAGGTGTGAISGNTLTVTTAGSFVIDANQAGNANYTAAPQVQQTAVVNLASQAINFTQPTTPITYAPSLTVTLVATGGGSGNPVVFTIAGGTGTGTLSGNTLTVTTAGSFVIDANQAGNANYTAAPQVQQTAVVNLAAQAINFTQPTTPITYAPSLTVSLVATGGASGNPVVFTIDGTSTGAGSISGSTLSITTPGTFVIDANQAGNANYSAAPQVQRSLVVNKAPQAINFTQPTTPVTYNAGLTIPLVATGGASGNPVIFSINPASTATGSITGSTLMVSTPGAFLIDANQTGNTDYSAATQVQQTITVNAPSPQAINFTQPTTPITYAPSLTVSLVATGGASGNPVVFTIDGTSTGASSISGSTLSITTPGTFIIDANQAGNANYSAAPQVQRTVVVTQAPQAINFSQPTSPVTYSSGLTIALTATGGASGNAVIFTIDSTSTASATVSGSTVTITGAGNLVIDANQAGNTDYSAAPQVQRTVVIDALPGDFSIFAKPASQTVNAGTTANYTITVDGINAFAKNVVLSVTGYPLGSTVTFSPPQVNPGDGPATSALSVLTPPGLFAQSQPGASFWPVATPTLALLLLLPFRRWRKAVRGRLFPLVAVLASLATAAALTGCGGGFALPRISQSYTLTVTGTSGSDTHSTTVQLTVQ